MSYISNSQVKIETVRKDEPLSEKFSIAYDVDADKFYIIEELESTDSKSFTTVCNELYHFATNCKKLEQVKKKDYL